MWFLPLYVKKMESAGAQELYSDDMRVWNALFQLMIRDFASAQEHGIDLGEPNGKIYPIILGNKGDWSYLVPWWRFGWLFIFSCFLHWGCLFSKQGCRDVAIWLKPKPNLR